MTNFLKSIGDQLSAQFALSNDTTTLDKVVDGQTVKYGSLGDYSLKFDQSARRSYLEEGYLRRDSYNSDSKQLEILMQQPDATILVKKRMFSSVAENYRTDFMDADEKMFFKAMKFLFQNKCKKIAILEKLGKIQKITSATGNIGSELLPLLFSLTDQANANSNPDNINSDLKSLTNVINQVRKLYSFNHTNLNTTWITDNSNLYKSQLGEGTGVIEITNFTNLNTSCSVNPNSMGENFSFNISDPYELMSITEYDIELAISDATNNFYNHKISQFGQDAAASHITTLQTSFNTLRSTRKASSISFNIDPNTILGKRIRVIVDRTGEEINFNYDSTSALTIGLSGSGVTVADDYLTSGSFGFNGLNNTIIGKDSELSLFQDIIKGIFNQLSEQANSVNAFQTSNKNTNYARKKLRFNFLGKLIIQPMDSVHIYISSKSKFDNKLLGGLKQLFNGASAFQSLGQSVIDVKNQFDMLFAPTSNVNMQFEKATYVGADFPNYLWTMLRSQFITEKEGAHVFAGVVDAAIESYSEGTFNVSVTGKDNKSYLTLGKINFKPSVDTFSGSFFDPLTPFKSNFDTVSTNFKDEMPILLDENKFLLGSAQDTDSPLVKFKLGPNAGRPSNQENIIQDHSVDPLTGQYRKTFFAPDGLVYKWKEGVGSFIQFGSSLDLNNPANVGTPSLAKDPFGGQDIMNVISLCITGQPYNFATYWQAVTNFEGIQKDPHSSKDSAHSFYDSLRKDLQKSNAIWGNFIPFKTLSINDKAFAEAQITLSSLSSTNSQIKDKLKKLNDLENQASALRLHTYSDSANTDSSLQSSLSTTLFQKIQTQVLSLTTEIGELIKKTQEQNNTFINIGDQITLGSNAFSDNNDPLQNINRQNLRKQINLLTRRMSYNIRANDDKNLFIVDDSYDKDYDLIAYNKDLENAMQLYSSAFDSVISRVKDSAELLNLEVFCDTQGHLRVRSPQYNRMPSSVFYRMMYLKNTLGVQVFPQFLEDLFSTQIKTLKEAIEVIEDRIRLDCAVLGKYNDSACADFLIDSQANKGGPFQFISDQDAGTIVDISDINSNDSILNKIPQDLSNKLNGNISLKNIFTNAQRFSFIQNALLQKKQAAGTDTAFSKASPTDKTFEGDFTVESTGSITDPDPASRINKLMSRIQRKTGVNISKNYFFETPSTVDISQPKYIDIFKVTQDLSTHLNDRQRAIKLFASAIKNAQDYKSLDDPDTSNKLASQLLLPSAYGNKNIPEVFEHMLEDETYDDYGPGSGKRFIIKNSQIKNYTVRETSPAATMIEVQGTLNQQASDASSLPSGLVGGFPGGGNGLVSAIAVDYDMWRTYGWRNHTPIKVPFLTNPQTQCAPYAAGILSRNRKNILQADLTISGNEYMQPGEVIFLENRGLLFYVEKVSHSFSFGNSFTTNLTLTYGHTPGEYIPTYLDIIGKALYNNKDIGNLQIHRQSSAFNEASVGIIVNDPNSSSISTAEDLGGTYIDANIATINNILYTTGYKINQNNAASNNVKATIELRVYYDSSGASTDLQALATHVQNLMTGTANLNNINASKNLQKAVTLPTDSVKYITIDLHSDKISQSPSQKAWDAVRNINQTYSPSKHKAQTVGDVLDAPSKIVIGQEKDKLKQTLFNCIIDCWLKFETLPPSPSTNTTDQKKAV